MITIKRILLCCPKINEHSEPWIRRLAAYSYRSGFIPCLLRFRWPTFVVISTHPCVGQLNSYVYIVKHFTKGMHTQTFRFVRSAFVSSTYMQKQAVDKCFWINPCSLSLYFLYHLFNRSDLMLYTWIYLISSMTLRSQHWFLTNILQFSN